MTDNSKRDKLFEELGELQRGAPEHAMLAVQRANVGGVLSPVVEHAGDIIHRMSHHMKYEQSYPDLVHEKAVKVSKALKHPYGFEKEHEQNIRANAKYKKVSEEEHRKGIDAALEKYAHEHSKLPVYNEPQWHAREASVAIGRKKFEKAAMHLDHLAMLSADHKKFHEAASKIDPKYFVEKKDG